MAASLFLSFAPGAIVSHAPDDRLAFAYGPSTAMLAGLSPGVRRALEELAAGGGYEDDLAARVVELDGVGGLTTFYYMLDRLTRWKALLRSVYVGTERLATLVPVSAYFQYAGRQPAAPAYALSRFTYARAEAGDLWLESSTAYARIRLHDARAMALFSALASPCEPGQMASRLPGLPGQAVMLFLILLLNAGMLTEVDAGGRTSEDEDPWLRTWEFHDLLFQACSREGRHDRPIGGTFPFLGVLDPPPALKPLPLGPAIELIRPDLERLRREDPPFAQVQDSRRSIREYGTSPLTAAQLGEFLYRVGRVTETAHGQVRTAQGWASIDYARRPYPGAGGLYELELYPLVKACQSISPGLYYYHPLDHRLILLARTSPEVELLLAGASQATGIPSARLQVIIVIAARFQRRAWKYRSIAYSNLLKDVGVLMQTMYLVATAMHLAPCAAGCGNADAFTRVAGTNYYEETSVGEFLLGSRAMG